MRKVKFQKWIPAVWINPTGNTTDNNFIPGHRKEGTGCLSEPQEGIFHCWGVEIQETNEQIASYTIAIIEQVDGQTATAIPERVKFIDQVIKDV